MGRARYGITDAGTIQPELTSHMTVVRKITCLAVRLPALSVVALGFWFLALPPFVDLVLAIVLIIVLTCTRRASFLIFCGASVLTFGLLELMLRSGWVGLVEHYREHERYVRADGTYTPDVDAVIEMPHGDLLAVDPQASSVLIEPRRVHFQTDALGYRNRHRYADEPLVLLGDSFVVGNGTSQEEILSEQLAARAGVRSYSLGHPADPIDYEYRANWFLQQVRSDVTFWMFIFEGNDLRSLTPEALPSLAENRSSLSAERYRSVRSELREALVPFLRYPQILEKMVQRAEVRWGGGPRSVEEWDVRGRPLGVFLPQERVARSASVALDLDLPPWLWRRVGCVLFIPSKGRVYAPLAGAEYAARYGASAGLAKVRAIVPPPTKVVDLTPELQQRSRSILEGGSLTFWRDDTHWNGHGITAAVEAAVRECPALTPPTSQALTLPMVARRGETLLVDGASYHLKALDHGTVEYQSVRPYARLIGGWVFAGGVDPREGALVGILDGRVVARTTPRLERGDLAAAFGERSRFGGFTLAIPELHGQPEVYYLSADKIAYEIPVPLP